MNASRLNELPSVECLLEPSPTAAVSSGFTSDLLSDIMAHAEEDSVILTIQAHKNTVAVASLVGCRALLVCSSRPVPADMLEAAKQERVGVYRTPMNQFAASIAVHQLLSSS